MKNILISKFQNYQTTNPVNIYLLDWLKDATFKNEVNKIRTLKNKEERNKLKSKLPCVTPSGTFSSRSSKGLLTHSGYICIDIDADDNLLIKDFEGLRDELKKIKSIAYAGLSVSGRGVFCLIPIMFPEKHKEHFEALKIQFLNIGITIDKACSDVSRLRGYSYDENAYFNENAVVFTQLFDVKSQQKAIIPKATIDNLNSLSKLNNSNDTHSNVMKIIKKISSSAIDITGDYKQWFEIGCSLANEFGEEGREMFHQVSQISPKYIPHICDNTFTSIISGNYSFTIGTFFHHAKEAGVI